MDNLKSHQGFAQTFKDNTLTIGLGFPLESYEGSFPKMDLEEQMLLAKKSESLGFASLFVRDSPLYNPKLDDVGALYDPWVFLSYVAAHTNQIALGTSSIVTTLRHPLHVAKSAASLDTISKQRLLLGVGSGDRPIEFPVFKVDDHEKAALFRESIVVMKKVWKESFPQIQTERVEMLQGDVVPKPILSDIPILGTGYSGQTIEWLAKHTDGWFFYSQGVNEQRELVKKWREAAGVFKPFAQSLAIDLSENSNEAPKPIKGGFRSGYKFLIDYLHAYSDAGVNHVMFGLKNSKRPAAEVIQELGEYIVPHFSPNKQ
ncbi:LLM class oxidoreductase [Jeotgalibacillus proteolyticus]|uniref:LLM class flavin-dependent oxidoreductase n=1 Tax=Jeotgalibacillus proteolyticus TaxID=2082395 RepID=A0A2S5G8U3_9BACL|nr:LLM class oxidoreductase [Jeotgalibacillus proteolyticus]PPA69422.1 LLM class flavin-dependent oxidoreductase [Jeotgalibacillus proteolyticus]